VGYFQTCFHTQKVEEEAWHQVNESYFCEI
jgi:hypothetical protein